MTFKVHSKSDLSGDSGVYRYDIEYGLSQYKNISFIYLSTLIHLGDFVNDIEKKPIRLQSIFIDWSNIFVHANSKYRTKIDPIKLCDLVSNKDRVLQKHYFSGEDPDNTGQYNFHEGLKKKGFLVHTHELVNIPGKVYCPVCKIIMKPVCEKCGNPTILPRHKSKRIDILIAQKLLQTSDLYDEAILISGDQDFIPIVDSLRDIGKKVTIASFRETLSHEYLKSSDEIIYLDDYIDEIKQER